ncbi:MAG: STAS domain-containing protein [Clostridiaceae bacterium]|nr:STAS domain-containing protein [Clostridiaceae bacterium]
MDIRFGKEGNTLIVYLDGEIDHHTSMMIRERIDSRFLMEPVKNILLDFSKVTFMDSAGIGLILGRKSKAASVGGDLKIRNPRPEIRKILKLSKIDSMIV